MNERARAPDLFDDAEEQPETAPSTESAGSGGMQTAVGSGLHDDDGGDDEPPIEERMPRSDDPGRKGSVLQSHLGTASGLVIRVYSLPIEDLNLSTRAYEGLRRSGVTTVGHVLKKTEDELLALPKFGRQGYDELREKLNERGILPNATGVN